MQNNPYEFLSPREIAVETVTPFHARVTLEPLESGFGHTLGTTLRRILLSSMPVAAIVEAKIDGVLHEYSSIPGVQEDVIEILLNLKNVAIKLFGREEVTLKLNKKGPGLVTAGDIELEHDVQVVNPELVIAHLNESGELNMTLKVVLGRGYQSAASRSHGSEDKTVKIWNVDNGQLLKTLKKHPGSVHSVPTFYVFTSSRNYTLSRVKCFVFLPL